MLGGAYPHEGSEGLVSISYSESISKLPASHDHPLKESRSCPPIYTNELANDAPYGQKLHCT